VIVAVALVASLGMVFATPAAAGDMGRHLYVDYPHNVYVCEEFDVVAEICVDEAGTLIDDAVVSITLPDDDPPLAILVDENPELSAEHWVGDVCPEKCRETSFRLKCTAPGCVCPIEIEVFEADNPGSIILSRTIHICQKCKLEVEITAPTVTEYDISDVFGVTAKVRNKSNEVCEDAEVCLLIDGNANRVGGSDCYQVGPIAAGDTQEVNWTVHCNGETDVDLTVTAYGCGVPDECAEACADTIHIIQGQEDVDIPPCDLTVEILEPGPQCFDEDACPCEDFPVTVRVTHTGTDGTGNDLSGWVQLKVTGGKAAFGTGGPAYQNKEFGPISPGNYEDVAFSVHCEGAETEQGPDCDWPDFVDLQAEAFGCCQAGNCAGSGFTNESYGSWPWTPGDTDTYDDYINQTWIKLNLYKDPGNQPSEPFKTCINYCVDDDIYIQPVIENCHPTWYWTGYVTVISWTTDKAHPISLTEYGPIQVEPGEVTGIGPDAIDFFHFNCDAPGDVIFVIAARGGYPPENITLCDWDIVTIHQKTPASIDVVSVDAPDCAQYCEEFDVTATISYDGDADGAVAKNLSADISFPGSVTLVGGDDPASIGDLAYGDDPVELTWRFHCNGSADPTFEVTVTGTDEVCGGAVEASGSDSTEQIKLDVAIVEPDPCDSFYVSDTFCVTAEITDNDDDTCFSGLTAIISFPNGGADIVTDEDYSKPFALTDGDTQQMSWTVHCEAPGETDIVVEVTGYGGPGCDLCPLFNKKDSITVQQETPELKVEILSPDDSTYVATSQEFAVTAEVTNPDYKHKDRIAFNVPVTLNPGENASVIGDETQVIDEILPGESVIVTWTLHCDKPGDTHISVTVPEMLEPWGEKSKTSISWDELQGYYFSWMYDDTGDTRYRTFMDNPEMADPDRYDIDNDPDIYPDYLEWQDVGHGHHRQTGIVVVAGPDAIPPNYTYYYLAKVIAPEGTELMIRGPRGTAVTLIDTMGPFRLYQVKTDGYHGGIVPGDEFEIIPIPSNAGVHIAVTGDINYATAEGWNLPADWWAWLTTADFEADGNIGSWDKLDWAITRCAPSSEVLDAITIHQYPAAHLEVNIDRYPEEPIITCTEFPIHATITNTGWADATEVSATLSVEPEGSVRVSANDPDGGYTKYIGTIPGHGSQEPPAEVEWLLHCKVPCDSTITITVEGYDEYGLSFSQQTTWYEGQGYIEGHIAGEVHGYAHVGGYIEGWVCAAEMCMEPPDQDGSWLFVAGEFHGEAFFDAYIEGFIMGDVYFNGWVNEFTMVEDPFGPIPERFIEPDSVTVKQLPGTADLGVTKVADPETVTVGEEITITITVINNGPSDATGVVVGDVLLAGINYNSSSPSQGWYDVGSGMWAVGDLADGDDATLTISATVNIVSEINNIASVIAADQDDPYTSNNSAMATVTGEAREPVEEWCMPLDEGYNLISLTLIPYDTDIEQMLITDNNLDLRVASYWTGGPTGVGEWLNFWPLDLLATDLTTIEDGKGYWLDLDTAVDPDDDLCYEGWELVGWVQVDDTWVPSLPPSYDMVEGWNLMGFKSTTPKPAEEYLAAIASKYVMIYGYDDGIYFIAGSPGHEYLEPGLGYWIAMTEPGTIYP